MRVDFSKTANEELKDYKKHLLELKKKGELPSYVKIPESLKKLKKIIIEELSRVNNHKDSIYPKDCEFGKDYKIGTRNEKNYISFYDIVKDSKGESYISIERCLHFTKLKKELDRKGIKPKEDADPYVLLDLLKIERGDEVAKLEDGKDSLPEELQKEFDEREKELESRIESQNKKEEEEKEKSEDKKKEEKEKDKEKEEDGEIEKEDTDKDGNPRQHKTGPEGGKYYRVKIDGKWGPWNSDPKESKTFKSLSSLLLESKMISLNQYIKNRKVL